MRYRILCQAERIVEIGTPNILLTAPLALWAKSLLNPWMDFLMSGCTVLNEQVKAQHRFMSLINQSFPANFFP